MFTPEAATAAQSVHNWTRFAALVTGTAGALLLIITLVVASGAASKYPLQRGLIAGIGTAYATLALVMLCLSFLLVRYGQKLELAAKQRRAALLVEAVPYETGVWAIAAGYVGICVLIIVISALTPATRQFPVESEQAAQFAQTSPSEGTPEPIIDEGVVMKLNIVCGAFALVGLVMVIDAIRPL
jgi:hypothetical protein